MFHHRKINHGFGAYNEPLAPVARVPADEGSKTQDTTHLPDSRNDSMPSRMVYWKSTSNSTKTPGHYPIAIEVRLYSPGSEL